MGSPKRSGSIALLGRPNAGKSTLINALVGEKVAIVSSRPQTTRNRIVGIVNDTRGQAVLLDLPGVHRPRHRMNTKMMQEVRSAIEEVEVVLHLIDANIDWGGGEAFLFDLIEPVTKPVIGVITKIDLVRPKQMLLPLIERYGERRPGAPIVPISSRKSDGLDTLLATIFQRLPEGPPGYPADITTTQTERFFIAEAVREKVLSLTRDELPYTTGVLIDYIEEDENLLSVDATIYVERPSQKGIVIGRGGSMIKNIGQSARLNLERLLSTRVHLALHVKVHPRWREDARILMQMEPGMADLCFDEPEADEPS
ncbi:MAG: GTPase Era [bacterium]|nr:GTPase Era [bacterium]